MSLRESRRGSHLRYHPTPDQAFKGLPDSRRHAPHDVSELGQCASRERVDYLVSTGKLNNVTLSHSGVSPMVALIVSQLQIDQIRRFSSIPQTPHSVIPPWGCKGRSDCDHSENSTLPSYMEQHRFLALKPLRGSKALPQKATESYPRLSAQRAGTHRLPVESRHACCC